MQLHGEKIKATHDQLPKQLIRIWVQPATLPHYQDAEIKFNHLNEQQDFILFDYQHPGLGQSFDWQQFQYQGAMRWGVAGGLHAGNVKDMLRFLNPHLIDVSSGVENQLGQKDLNLIERFIKNL